MPVKISQSMIYIFHFQEVFLYLSNLYIYHLFHQHWIIIEVIYFWDVEDWLFILLSFPFLSAFSESPTLSQNGLALVRPPGHHAMQNQAMYVLISQVFSLLLFSVVCMCRLTSFLCMFTVLFKHCGLVPVNFLCVRLCRAFCYFNNVALAAKSVISKNRKVAIVDWVREPPHSFFL